MKEEEDKKRYHCSLPACEKLGAIRRHNEGVVRHADDGQHHENHDGANNFEACAVDESIPRHNAVETCHVALSLKTQHSKGKSERNHMVSLSKTWRCSYHQTGMYRFLTKSAECKYRVLYQDRKKKKQSWKELWWL